MKKNTSHAIKTREKIKTTNLLLRLQQYALGEEQPGFPGRKVEMTAGQIKAAHILINKTLPDLTSSDINVTQEMPSSKAEMFEKLEKALGRDLALKVAPEFAEPERVLN